MSCPAPTDTAHPVQPQCAQEAWVLHHPAYQARKALLLGFARANGLVFHDPVLLFIAFVNRSFTNELVLDDLAPDNERLEFLGDAVLAKVTSECLCRRFPEHQEGALTQMRATLTCGNTLAQWARDLDLGRYLLLGKSGERDNLRQNPRILANTLEALIGAIQSDQGDSASFAFLQRWLVPAMEELAVHGLSRNTKSQLQELVQARAGATPRYECISATGPDHAREFVVRVTVNGQTVGIGHSSSLKRAGFKAAENALREPQAWNTRT